MKTPAVYLLASRPRGTLYVGVTSDLLRRIAQHKSKIADGFTRKYNVETLVWYELHSSMATAIAREKAIKKWLRRWKLELIETSNPAWCDLWPEISGHGFPRSRE